MRHPFLRTLAGSVAPTPPTTDPNFENVTLLLHGDGTNGGQNNTFVDGSTNAFSITQNGNTTQGTFSPYGDLWSTYFDGTGDYLLFAANSTAYFGTADFTMECWFYRQAPKGQLYHDAIFGNRATVFPARVWSVQCGPLDGDPFSFQLSVAGSSWSISGGSCRSGTWNHIAVVRIGNTFTLYINGGSVATGTQTAEVGEAATGISVGAFRDGAYPSIGYVSNLRLVNGTALYVSNFTPPTAPLTSVPNTILLGCQSPRFIDNSPYNLAVSRFGDVSVQRFSPFSPTAAYSTSTIGGGGVFDGNGDYLSVPSSSQLDLVSGNFTIELWVYPRSYSSSNRTLLSKDGQFAVSYSQYALAFNNAGNIVANVGSGNGTTYTQAIGSTTPLQLYSWHHIAFVKNGTTLTLYVNGVSAASATQTGTMVTGNKALIIGWEQGQPLTHYTDGYLSNVRIVKGTAVYTAAFTPPTAPLTAITNTSLLLNFTNAAILDNAMMAVPETVGNAQIDTTIKKYGTGSMKFDGTGDYLTVLNNPSFSFGTGDFTIEAWVYIAGNSTADAGGLRTATVIGAFQASGSPITTSYGFTINGSTTTTGTGLGFSLWQSGVNYAINVTTTITQNVWHHVAVARSGTLTKLFLNGTEVGSGTLGNQNITTAFAATIGRIAYSGYLNELNGYIDDLRITKGVARYTSNFTPPTAAFPDL